MAIALVTGACTILVGETPTVTQPAESSTTSAPTTTTRQCEITKGRTTPVDTGSPATDALFLSREIFECSDDVVIVGSDDLNEVAAAAQLAAALEAPLLFPDPVLGPELDRLGPVTVHVVGGAEFVPPQLAEVRFLEVSGAAETAGQVLDVPHDSSLPSVPDSTTIVDTVRAIAERDRVVFPSTPVSTTRPGSSSTMASPPEPTITTAEVVVGLARRHNTDTVWVMDAAYPSRLLLAAAFARTAGAAVTAVDGTDVLRHPEVATVLRGRSPGEIRLVGPLPDAEWELAVLRAGEELPGGGFYVFPPEQKRRYVAFYGHPNSAPLGALGEQGPVETLERMQPFLDAYSADGSLVIPTFELIASMASAGPTEDGDYSFEWPNATFEEWIDVAGENDVYVVFDLQSGREDFLSQAQTYAELLELPFVGLALDPEWRLGPDQVHLRQIGRVDATEVNQVIHWLADMIRERGLPQKMLIVHQFRLSMIENRELLEPRPEVALVIQMDGDGTEAEKDATYLNITSGTEDTFWSWGWKNFFDEDEPGPPTPESTMGKVPTPVYVSYQ